MTRVRERLRWLLLLEAATHDQPVDQLKNTLWGLFRSAGEAEHPDDVNDANIAAHEWFAVALREAERLGHLRRVGDTVEVTAPGRVALATWQAHER